MDLLVHLGRFDILMIIMAGILSLIPVFCGIYYVVLFFRAPLRRKVQPLLEEPATRFAVLIPACNESQVIGRVLDSLAQLDYPAELMDIIVIADNCTDNTATLAAQRGVRVLKRRDRIHRTKMHALNWAFYEKGLLDAGYDAFCIVDADVVVTPQFLRRMEVRIRAGHAVVAGRCESINANETFVSAFASFLYLMSNRLVNVPLANRGLSFLYYGSGFTVRCDHLKRIGWKISTLVEDTEFALQTILAGEKVTYCDDAEYATEQPVDFNTFWKQQRRWITGLTSCGRIFTDKTFEKSVRDRDASAFMGFMRLVMPFNCVLGIIQMIWAPALFFTLYGNGRVTMATSLLGFVGTILIGIVFGIAVLIIDGKSIRKYWKGALMPGLLPMFFGVLSIVCMMRPKQGWELIQHGAKQPARSEEDRSAL